MFFTIVEDLNREAYKCIATAYDHEAHAKPNDSYLCNIIALEIGTDKEALEALDLGPLDETIEAARPHVLVGPRVCKLW